MTFRMQDAASIGEFFEGEGRLRIPDARNG
jgi:hypothetical protein